MPRNSTLPLLSRAQAANTSITSNSSDSFLYSVPTIRFISAGPSVAVDPDTTFNPVAPFASSSPPASLSSSPLAPRLDSNAPRKRLVPKKSKLSLLTGSSRNKDRENNNPNNSNTNSGSSSANTKKGTNDFSDVIRRVGGGSSTGRGGFEIYVDHADDPDIEEIIVVKKKKSRLGLDGMKWGALGEVTNVPSSSQVGTKEERKKEKERGSHV